MQVPSKAEQNRQLSRLATGRDVCGRCRRPSSGCYCAHVTPIDTQTRLILLQHPRERDVATAWLSGYFAARGVWGVRVHDVRATRDAIAVAERMGQ